MKLKRYACTITVAALCAAGSLLHTDPAFAQPACTTGMLAAYRALTDGCKLGGIRVYGVDEAYFLEVSGGLHSYLPDAFARIRIAPLPVVPGSSQVGLRVQFPVDLMGEATAPRHFSSQEAWFYLRLGSEDPDWRLYGGTLANVVGSFSNGTGWTGRQLISIQRYSGGPGSFDIDVQKPGNQITPLVAETCFAFSSPCSFLPFGTSSDAYLKIDAMAVAFWEGSIGQPSGAGAVATRLTSFDLLLNVSQPAPQSLTPEPGTLALLSSGMLALGFLTATRRKEVR
jgi:hypothetical protein